MELILVKRESWQYLPCYWIFSWCLWSTCCRFITCRMVILTDNHWRKPATYCVASNELVEFVFSHLLNLMFDKVACICMLDILLASVQLTTTSHGHCTEVSYFLWGKRTLYGLGTFRVFEENWDLLCVKSMVNEPCMMGDLHSSTKMFVHIYEIILKWMFTWC